MIQEISADAALSDLSKFKFPPLSDGPHWSPDGGYFWAKDGKYYWPDGDVTESPPCRLWDRDGITCENFSEWSDEKRAAVLAETKAKQSEREAAQKIYQIRLESIMEIVRGKLTADELQAVEEYFRE